MLAFRHVTQMQDLSVVVGYAGTGKSTMLGEARAAWEAEGYQVRGAALSGIAAEQLEARRRDRQPDGAQPAVPVGAGPGGADRAATCWWWTRPG